MAVLGRGGGGRPPWLRGLAMPHVLRSPRWGLGRGLAALAQLSCWNFRRKTPKLRKKAVFGQRLDETVAYEQKFGPHLVPILVEKCAEFILQHGLHEEGIFRLPGQDNLVKQLRDAFDAGERPSFDRDTDVHTVASLLKLYLRDLPEPVVPWSQYEGFLLCGQLMNADEAKAQQELVKQLSLLPRDNYSLLSYLCRFLHEIQLNCAVNKMSVDNLATVIGVNLIRSKVEDPAVIMRGAPQIQRVMTMMIRDHEVLFPKSKDVPLSPPAQKNDPKKPPVARSSVGWDATEDPPISRADSFSNTTSNSDATSPTGQQPSDGCLEESSKAPREKLGDWKLQSRKRTQTLPNRKCFLTSAFQDGGPEAAKGNRNTEAKVRGTDRKPREGKLRCVGQGGEAQRGAGEGEEEVCGPGDQPPQRGTLPGGRGEEEQGPGGGSQGVRQIHERAQGRRVRGPREPRGGPPSALPPD